MNLYTVMLEGQELNKSYLITYEIIANSDYLAKKIVLEKAQQDKLKIVCIEEVNLKKANYSNIEEPEITKIYGKAYF